MKLRIFEFYDSKTESWGVFPYQPSRGDAERLIRKLVNSREEGGNIFLYPGDFTFFETGEYDLGSGVHVMYESKFNLGVGTEFKNKE